jgi:hypothetical protein
MLESYEEIRFIGKVMATNISVITSFDQRYYELIGKDCVESWLTYWPSNMKLTCYVENFNIPADDRIIQIPFTELCQEYSDLINSDENDRVKTFAKKAYSIIHAFENSNSDYIVWIDADVISTKHLTNDIITEFCKSNILASYMGVTYNEEGVIYNAAETGIFSVNRNHPMFSKFAARYREYYDKRIKNNIRRFYDGDVFGAVAHEFKSITSLYNICESSKKNYKTPLKHTFLGPYVHHYKAKHSKDAYANQ